MIAYYLKVKANENKEVFLLQRKALIAPFLNKMFEFLMSGDAFHSSIIDSTSNAFFALICFSYEGGIYHAAATKLISEQVEDLQMQASQAFAGLLNGVEAKFDQNNCPRFLANFKIFLTVYRGIVKKK